MKRMVSWLLLLCLLCAALPAHMEEAPTEPVVQENSPAPVTDEGTPPPTDEGTPPPTDEGTPPPTDEGTTPPTDQVTPPTEDPTSPPPQESETPAPAPQAPLFWPEDLVKFFEEQEEEVLRLAVGATLSLPLGIRDDIAATNPTILWESADENLATVDEDGVVTGVAAGDVEIKASLKDDPSICLAYPVRVFGEAKPEDPTAQPSEDPTTQPSEEPEEGTPSPDPSVTPESGSPTPEPSVTPAASAFADLQGQALKAGEVFQLPPDGNYYAYQGNTSQLIPFLTEEYAMYADSLTLVSGNESILRVEGANQVFGVAAGSCELLVRLSDALYCLLPVQVIEAPVVDGVSLLQAVLPKTTSIAWSANKAFGTWKSVQDADLYYVELFRDSASVKRWFIYENPSIMPGDRSVLLGNLMNTSGTYYFTVEAVFFDETSSPNVAKSPNYIYNIPSGTVQLDPPENVKWRPNASGDITLYFDNPRNFTADIAFVEAFPAEIYRNGLKIKDVPELTRGTTLKSLIGESEMIPGDYTFKVQTISADHQRYTNSAWATSDVHNLRQANDALLWAYIQRIYSIAFQRTPDTYAQTWFDSLKRGDDTGASVASGCFLSPEYANRHTSDRQFVEEIYRVCYDRVPASSEIDYWASYLTRDATRASVLNQMVTESLEFTQVCARYGIKKGYVPNLRPIDKELLTTLFVIRIYEKVLNRKAPANEVNHWCGLLIDKRVYGNQMANDFIFGQESLNRKLSNTQFIVMLYEALMDRSPDSNDLSYWLNEMAKVEAKKGDSRRMLFNEFVKSLEYANIMSVYGVKAAP